MFGPLKKPSRLGRWDGRKRSSRGEEFLWTHLWRRTVLLRVGLVLLTTLAVTCLVYFWGPPFPYRVGEIYSHDIKVRVDFELVDHVELINQSSENPSPDLGPNGPNTDPTLVEKALTTTKEQSPLDKFKVGKIIVQAGKPISERQLAILKKEHIKYRNSLKPAERFRHAAGLFLVFGLLALLLCLYVVRFDIPVGRSLPGIVGVGALVLVTVAAGLFASPAPWHAVFLPMTISAMILTLAYSYRFSMLMSVAMSIVMVVALGTDLTHLLVLLSGLATVVLLLRGVRSRTQLVKVACCTGIVYFLMTLATGLLSPQTWDFIVADASRRFIWGTLAGFLLTGLLPVVERAFGIVTDISLRDLADGSHPLLEELVRRAPGTYTHSITVGTLAESAAEAIGANPLLTRVGSYFHDVGKMLKPLYFIENQNGENKHDSLEPALSTLIIIGHVKDGVALAKQYNLPKRVIDFIEQHHGTTLVEYFYREAVKLQESNGNGHTNGELEATFRYPGPKPQNRENGILMLADAVESASRSLVDPTPTRIRKLVHDLLMKRLLDGQFEESNLTLTELHIIEESLCKSLIALFHVRIKYEEEEPIPMKV